MRLGVRTTHVLEELNQSGSASVVRKRSHSKRLYEAFLMTKFLLSTMGRLGTTVAGTDPRSTGGHPNFQLEKGDSK
jgi:hypothetical protein